MSWFNTGHRSPQIVSRYNRETISRVEYVPYDMSREARTAFVESELELNFDMNEDRFPANTIGMAYPKL